MSKPNEHSRLINAAAKAVLQPLGFQQRGRSRLWIADRGYWALLVGFRPSAFSKGSDLDVSASWLWHPGTHFALNYFHRAGEFISFETVEQFRPEAEKLAALAGDEAALLDKKLNSLDAIAAYLKQETRDPRVPQNPWTLYHAAIGAGLTGERAFASECFKELIAQKPNTDWEREIQAEAKLLAKLLAEGQEFPAAIQNKVAAKRKAWKLPPLDGLTKKEGRPFGRP